jgi:predicted acyltransferase
MATLTTTAATVEARGAALTQRLASLDVFRGLTIAGMILVNDAGDWNAIYAPLQHADWHGWTPTDLIFPFFMFIVGVSLVFSFDARQRHGATNPSLYRHIVIRAAVIFALGLFLAGYPFLPPRFHWGTLRIPGVLQRIAVCYLLASLVYLTTPRKWRAALTALLLIGYFAIMMLVPVPGYGAGNLTQAGNLEAYVDRQLLMGHLWSPRHQVWDPEGILSTFPAIATVLLGTFVGEWLRSPRNSARKAAGLLVVGAAGLVVGEIWNLWFPINKNLWTSSFVVFTAGFAMVMLGICYWLIDVKGWRAWSKPFLMVGMNPLALYFLSEFVAINIERWRWWTVQGRSAGLQDYLYTNFFAPLAQPINASLLWAVAYTLVFMLVGWAMYRAKIFVKI